MSNLKTLDKWATQLRKDLDVLERAGEILDRYGRTKTVASLNGELSQASTSRIAAAETDGTKPTSGWKLRATTLRVLRAIQAGASTVGDLKTRGNSPQAIGRMLGTGYVRRKKGIYSLTAKGTRALAAAPASE